MKPIDVKHIILSPHFDDAVISLGGYLDILGKKATVVTFYCSSPIKPVNIKIDIKSNFKDSKEAMKYRAIENDRALEILNNNVFNYKYEQCTYRKKRITHIEQKEQTTEITNDINDMLKKHKDEKVAIYGPTYLGVRSNRDHKILHNSYIDVVRASDNVKHVFYMYEDYPYCDNFRIKYDILKNTTLTEYISSLYTDLTIVEKIVKLNSNNLENKLKAILEYSSQVKCTDKNPKSKLFLLTNAIKYNRERYKNIRACEVIHQMT